MSLTNCTFITQTKLEKEQQKLVNSLLTSLFDSSDSFEFRQPVDYKALGLVDYPQIIKNPMDLGTIKKKFKESKYKYVEEALNDIQLVWDNCKTFNAEGSWIYKKAEKLEKLTNRLIKQNFYSIYSKRVPGINKGLSKEVMKSELKELDKRISSENIEEVTYEEKYRFCQDIRSLLPPQLTALVKTVKSLNADAYQELDNERCHILVEKLKRDVFVRLAQQVEEWVAKDSITKKIKLN